MTGEGPDSERVAVPDQEDGGRDESKYEEGQGNPWARPPARRVVASFESGQHEGEPRDLNEREGQIGPVFKYPSQGDEVQRDTESNPPAVPPRLFAACQENAATADENGLGQDNEAEYPAPPLKPSQAIANA